jgi:FKBP-type peptidyl-prolyl cis-trans isomerase 2
VVEVDLAYTVESGADCSSASARRFTQANNGRRGLLVGRSAPLPGLDRLPAMRKGEHQSVTLSPEHAFGRRDPGRISIYPRRKTLPVEFLMPAIPDAQGCSGEPVVGRIVDLSQPIRAEVLKVVDHRWVVRVLACHGERFEAPYGVTEARIAGQEVAFELTPRVGAPLPGPEGVGTILSAGAENFTVDFNHPLAGCALRLDLTVRAIHKASALEAVEIAWRSDGEELSAADGHGEKPTVLVLYAGWCAWSQKMLAESLQDPLVLSLADRFAWRKIDSSERPSLKETYRQNSYPLIVVLSKEGEEIGRLEGFQSGDALYAYLDRLWRGVEDIQ